ncbi:MAG: hypothetical protein CUN55_02015 [Phototrophicales bacterium]|nr:MAG: hypothetical protein CUN55_02015 [Phototrophicales bacterium]
MRLKRIFLIVLLLGVGGVFWGTWWVFSTAQAQDNGVLNFNQVATGTLDADIPRQEWTINAPPATSVTLTVARTAGKAPITMQLFNNLGNILVNITTDNTGLATIPQLYLEGGSYRLLLLANFEASQEAVSFNLSVATTGESILPNGPTALPNIVFPTPTPEPQSPALELVVGQSYDGIMTQPNEEVRFIFLGYADEHITFGMNAPEDSGVDPAIELRAPDGSVIAQSDDYYGTRQALVIYFQLPSTGIYELIARNESATGTGEYQVAIGADFVLRDVDRGFALHNRPIIATLETLGVRDVWLIELEAGESVTISVEDWGELPIDPMVELVGPSGDTLGFDDDGGGGKNAFLSNIVAPISGQYRIHVAAYDHGSAGTYRLLWRVDDRVPTPTAIVPTLTPTPLGDEIAVPTLPAIQISTINELRGSEYITIPEGGYAERRVTLTEGQQLNVYIEGYWGFDAILDVYTPSGYLIDRVDDVGYQNSYDINPRLTLVADEDGIYALRIYGFEERGGDFSLHWSIEE